MIKKTGEMRERKKTKSMKNRHINKIYKASEEIQSKIWIVPHCKQTHEPENNNKQNYNHKNRDVVQLSRMYFK